MILYIADLFRWLMRTSVRNSRTLSSFNFYRSSALQSKIHDDARWAARHSSLFNRYQSTQTGNSLRLLRFGGV